MSLKQAWSRLTKKRRLLRALYLATRPSKPQPSCPVQWPPVLTHGDSFAAVLPDCRWKSAAFRWVQVDMLREGRGKTVTQCWAPRRWRKSNIVWTLTSLTLALGRNASACVFARNQTFTIPRPTTTVSLVFPSTQIPAGVLRVRMSCFMPACRFLCSSPRVIQTNSAQWRRSRRDYTNSWLVCFFRLDSFVYAVDFDCVVWNGLPSDVTSASSLSVLKNRLKTSFFRCCYETIWPWMTFPFPSHYLPIRTVVLAIVYTV